MTLAPLIVRSPPYVNITLPVRWIERAAGLPGKALHVAMVLLYLTSLRKSAEVRFSQRTLRRFGTSRDASYDALTRMTAAGLVRLKKSPGRAHVVMLLGDDGRPMTVL